MPKFTFSLHAVLTQRKHAEMEKQRALGQLLAQMSTLESELHALDDTAKSASADLRSNHLVGPVDLAFLAAHRRFLLATERKARAIIQRMSLLETQLQQARALLVEAARARKVVEKLRERKFEAWRSDLLRREQQQTDEVGGTLTILEWQAEARDQADQLESLTQLNPATT